MTGLTKILKDLTETESKTMDSNLDISKTVYELCKNIKVETKGFINVMDDYLFKTSWNEQQTLGNFIQHEKQQSTAKESDKQQRDFIIKKQNSNQNSNQNLNKSPLQ